MSDDIKYKKCCNCDTLVSVHPLIVTPVYCDECYIGSSTLKKQAATIASLRAENDRLRKALAFYRSSNSYIPHNNKSPNDTRPLVIQDGGLIAYKALGVNDGK